MVKDAMLFCLRGARGQREERTARGEDNGRRGQQEERTARGVDCWWTTGGVDSYKGGHQTGQYKHLKWYFS